MYPCTLSEAYANDTLRPRTVRLTTNAAARLGVPVQTATCFYSDHPTVADHVFALNGERLGGCITPDAAE